MPSLRHEALLRPFRDRPVLAAELLRDALGVPVPAVAAARIADATLSQLVPPELAADLVVVLEDPTPRLAIVVEVQLAARGRKRFVWPLYAAALRAQLEAPACVLVVAPDARVAAWARRPIALGPPDSVFTPLVLGPEGIPWVRDQEEARRAPELALLSALAHGAEPGGGVTALAAVTAAAGLDVERGGLYYDLVLAVLPDAVRRELEAVMASGQHAYHSTFARKFFRQGRTEGRAEGRAEALLAVFAARGLEVTEAQRTRVLACTDLATLDRWIGRAVSAASVDEALAE